MKIAVNYLRYSSDSQTEQSIEGQIRVCKQFAESHDILIVDSYIDRAMTGTNDNRPAFQRMIKDSAKKEWDYVLVYKLDRFSRNKYEMAVHKKTLKDNGVKVLSATEYIPDTPEAIIFESMLEGYAEYYSAELSQKVRRGMNETRQKGNFTGGYLIYGYKKEGKKVVVDEEQAEVVRHIFEQYAMNVYVKDIIAELNKKGITNHGKPFARNTIYNTLKNEKYSGVYRHGNEVFENIYPQIVPTELFEKVRKKTNQNKYGKRSVEVVYLLRNKVKCGYCGSPISAECGTAKSGKKIRYYKCLGRKHRNGCTKSMVRKEYLEELVLDYIINELKKPENMNRIIEMTLEMQDKMVKENFTCNILLKEKKQVKKSLDNLVLAMQNGIFSNATNAKLHELENRLQELEKTIAIEKSKNSVKLTADDIRTHYEKGLRKEPKILINALVDEIVLFDDRIDIKFYTQIQKSPDDNQDFLFYSSAAKMRNTTQNNSKTTYTYIKVKMYL